MALNEELIINKLNDIFSDVFDEDNISVSRQTTAADVENWDSLEHIRLIAAVEREFKIRFTMKEVSAMKNVGEMIDIIASRSAL